MIRLLTAFMLFLALGSFGQGQEGRVVQKVITETGDTIISVSLDEVVIPESNIRVFRSDFDRMKYYVRKVYPYARITADIINEYDSAYAQLDRRRDKRKFMKRVERDLKDEFQDELKNLTVTQGRILIKLINRETGYTSYEIIKNVKGGLSAFFWQGVAKLFGSDLKDNYEKEKEDAMIEYIVRQIESGKLYVVPRERKTQIDIREI